MWRRTLKLDRRVIGIASTYNPFKPGDRSGAKTTASGEPSEANGWAAAIQIDLRAAFNGVRFGRNYRPTSALVTAGDKSAIVKIDVGPLLPGRVIDLTERATRYFGASLDRGVLPGVTVTPLAGERWRARPVDGGPALSMAGDLADDALDWRKPLLHALVFFRDRLQIFCRSGSLADEGRELGETLALQKHDVETALETCERLKIGAHDASSTQ
jgi:peptidoglycan lytic transglycosylase